MWRPDWIILSRPSKSPMRCVPARQEGYPVQDRDLAHVWPTRYAHLNVYGKYHFNVEEGRGRKGLRPLRQPGQRA